MSILFHSTACSDKQNIRLVENVCGAGAVHRMTMVVAGLTCLGFDNADGPLQDVNGQCGFIAALQWFRRIVSDGSEWLGTV